MEIECQILQMPNMCGLSPVINYAAKSYETKFVAEVTVRRVYGSRSLKLFDSLRSGEVQGVPQGPSDDGGEMRTRRKGTPRQNEFFQRQLIGCIDSFS